MKEELQDLNKRLEDLKQKRASLLGELTQIDKQFEDLGITKTTDVDKWVLKQTKDLTKSEDKMDSLMGEVEDELDKLESL